MRDREETKQDRFIATLLISDHKCSYGSAGRCACGLHRSPERATYIEPLATDRERLEFEV